MQKIVQWGRKAKILKVSIIYLMLLFLSNLVARDFKVFTKSNLIGNVLIDCRDEQTDVCFVIMILKLINNFNDSLAI